MELKSKLVELVEHAFQEEQMLINKLSEAERLVVGEPDCWSVKDIIVHIAGWKTRLAENLVAAASGGTPVRYEDFEAVNAKEFEENRDRSWSEVIEMVAKAHRLMVEQVKVRSEDELRGTETLPWQGERPLWQSIVGNSYTHSIGMHLGPIYVERGEKEYATSLQEEAAKLAMELDDDKDWQGVVRYNLACCHYALIGETERTIGELSKALELNPGLVEWSKKDPDLTSVREEPGYLALYSE
ncbi:MAG: ClbS/DfsB family four-helix bundle protein [Chloroflexi bacterium]|nr:ClbS/DfsB family four-helix bundle protein [Chloroflexota bacterium]